MAIADIEARQAFGAALRAGFEGLQEVEFGYERVRVGASFIAPSISLTSTETGRTLYGLALAVISESKSDIEAVADDLRNALPRR